MIDYIAVRGEIVTSVGCGDRLGITNMSVEYILGKILPGEDLTTYMVLRDKGHEPPFFNGVDVAELLRQKEIIGG